MFQYSTRTLRSLDKLFRDNNIKYALIGGYALRNYNNNRETEDIDFLVNCDLYDIDSLYSILVNSLNLSYICIHHSIITIQLNGISIDIVPAYTEYEIKILKDAKYTNIRGTKCRIARIEDLLLLKYSIRDLEERHLEDVYSICKYLYDIIDIKYLKKAIKELKIEKNIIELEKLLNIKYKIGVKI